LAAARAGQVPARASSHHRDPRRAGPRPWPAAGDGGAGESHELPGHGLVFLLRDTGPRRCRARRGPVRVGWVCRWYAV